MRIASGTVLGLAALVASPALWQAYTGALSVDVALTRYLIAVVVVWAALGVLGMLVGGTTPHGAGPSVPPAEEPPGAGRDAP